MEEKNKPKMSIEEFIAANKSKTEQQLDQHKSDIKRIIEELNRSSAFKYLTEVLEIEISLRTFYKYCDRHFKKGDKKEEVKTAPVTDKSLTVATSNTTQTVQAKVAKTTSVQDSLSREFDLLA